MGQEEAKQLMNSAFLKLDDQMQLQEALLIKQAAYWFNENNFFKEKLLTAGINSPEKLTLKSIKTIPTCNKNDLAEFSRKMHTVGVAIGDYCTTSGTTGKPITIPLTFSDIERLGLNEAISYTSMELTPKDVIMLCTTVDRTFMAGLAYLEGARKMKIPIVRAGIINPGMHWEHIQQYKVTTLVSVPSYLLKLLNYANENNIDPAKTSIKKILCIGENIRDENNNLNLIGEKILDEWSLKAPLKAKNFKADETEKAQFTKVNEHFEVEVQRRNSKILEVPVKLYGTYASTEMQTAFTECTYGVGMHHIPGLIICELLDEEGNEVAEGEVGELTITHLGVEGMPLLRFRTGDICILDKKPCECGRHSFRIKRIAGRKNSMLKYKGTTLYPSAIIEVLNAETDVEDFIVVARKNEEETDHVEIHICNHDDKESWKPFLESKLRVKPIWVKSSIHEIEKIRSERPSRKPLKFIDLRD